MKIRLALAAALAVTLFAPPAVYAATSTWTADPRHSSASFTALHLMIAHVNGAIPLKSATLEIPDGSNVPASVKAELDPSGVDTHNADRDADLRSEHFFEVGTYPSIVFASTKIVKTDDRHFIIDGTLTMHGQTHPVRLQAVFLARGTGGRGEPHIAYSASGTIDRTQWGMTYGTMVASKEIDVTIDVEAVKH